VKFVGIAPGLRVLGWGLVDESERALGWGALKIREKGSLAERFSQIEEELLKIIDLSQPDLAVMEAVVFHKNPKSALLLGGARAVVLLTLHRRGIRVMEVSPTLIKRAITGSGGSKKEQVGYMVRQILGINEEVSPHASDALACAIVGMWRMQNKLGESIDAPFHNWQIG
jgi:crossover junction endodeoxyribonuclease RuvC